MPNGQVKWFDPKKGFGFIIGPEGQDVFVHYSHIQSDGFRTLKDGVFVDYELLKGEKGWQARDVKISGDAGSTSTDRPATPASVAAAPAPAAGGYEGPTGSKSKGSGYEGSS